MSRRPLTHRRSYVVRWHCIEGPNQGVRLHCTVGHGPGHRIRLYCTHQVVQTKFHWPDHGAQDIVSSISIQWGPAQSRWLCKHGRTEITQYVHDTAQLSTYMAELRCDCFLFTVLFWLMRYSNIGKTSRKLCGLCQEFRLNLLVSCISFVFYIILSWKAKEVRKNIECHWKGERGRLRERQIVGRSEEGTIRLLIWSL